MVSPTPAGGTVTLAGGNITYTPPLNFNSVTDGLDSFDYTVQDNGTFNWRLIKAPTFVIDYVIVHELAHLIEANHTPRFWNVVRTHIPKMEKARAWLNENGQVLEEEI